MRSKYLNGTLNDEKEEQHFFLFLTFLYLAVSGLSCCLWNLVPRPEIEPRPLALGVQSLGYWTTREVPQLFFMQRDKRVQTVKAAGAKALAFFVSPYRLLFFLSLFEGFENWTWVCLRICSSLWIVQLPLDGTGCQQRCPELSVVLSVNTCSFRGSWLISEILQGVKC